jgi:hypothetical protein
VSRYRLEAEVWRARQEFETLYDLAQFTPHA